MMFGKKPQQVKKCLLIIDPQRDFCDPTGSLYVPGADKDMHRLAKIVGHYDHVIITLDTHPKEHIANASAWKILDKDFRVTKVSPPPFSQVYRRPNDSNYKNHLQSTYCIRSVDGRNDTEVKYVYAKTPTDFLQVSQMFDSIKNGPLTLWPDHCLGTETNQAFSTGNEVQEELKRKLDVMEKEGKVTYYRKGQNPFVESFSALMMEDGRLINPALLVELSKYDVIHVAGEASTHCVRRTMEDLARICQGGKNLVDNGARLRLRRPGHLDALNNHYGVQVVLTKSKLAKLFTRVRIIQNCMSPVEVPNKDELIERFMTHPSLVDKFIELKVDASGTPVDELGNHVFEPRGWGLERDGMDSKWGKRVTGQ